MIRHAQVAEHHHQAEARDVEAHRDHVGGKGNVDAFVVSEGKGQTPFGVRNLVGALTRRQLGHVAAYLSILE